MTQSATVRQANPTQAKHELVLGVAVPEGMDPAVAEALRPRMEHALELLLLSEQPRLLEEADRLAALLSGQPEPNLGLVKERLARLKTLREMLEEGEWLTAEQLNALQPHPPAQKAHPASDWKRRGRIFGVNYGGQEYFARYQFDETYQPLPVIKEILKALGEVADSWKIAAWFHFPNGWLARPGTQGQQALAPKDALDQRDAVLAAAAKRQGSYTA